MEDRVLWGGGNALPIQLHRLGKPTGPAGRMGEGRLERSRLYLRLIDTTLPTRFVSGENELLSHDLGLQGSKPEWKRTLPRARNVTPPAQPSPPVGAHWNAELPCSLKLRPCCFSGLSPCPALSSPAC